MYSENAKETLLGWHGVLSHYKGEKEAVGIVVGRLDFLFRELGCILTPSYSTSMNFGRLLNQSLPQFLHL